MPGLHPPASLLLNKAMRVDVRGHTVSAVRRALILLTREVCLHRICVVSYCVFTRSSTAGYVAPPHALGSMCLDLRWKAETHVTPCTVDVFFSGLFMDMGLLQQRGLHLSHPQVASLDGYDIVIGDRATLMPSA
jgi:hypothetical protein